MREVNRTALSSAFAITLSQLEAAAVDRGQDGGGEAGSGSGMVEFRLSRVVRAVRSLGNARRSRVGSGGGEMSRLESSAEKLAAELLWLAQKLAACGGAEEALKRWAASANLARLALWAEPRLQGFLVKISGILHYNFNNLVLIGEETLVFLFSSC